MSLAPPHMSVVVCTRDRPDTIEQAVVSILANTYQSFDLTVIDQSTSNVTEDILRPIIQGDPRMRYVHVQEAGLSRAYNTAIGCTEGELLAFTDDDCIVPPGWLAAISRAFSQDAEADLIYGQVFAPESPNLVGGETPALTFEQPKRFSLSDGFKVLGMGANFAARRGLFARIGGFDEILGGGAPLCSAQDYDLAYRTYRAGRAVLARPEIQVTHYGTRAPHEWPKTLRAYGIGDGAFYFKHVRCRDFLALRLLTRQIMEQSARAVSRRLRGRGPGNLTYVRFIFVGILTCLHFEVDRASRLYRPS